MPQLNEVMENVEHLKYNRGGTVLATTVYDTIVEPLLKLMEGAMAKQGRWITTSEYCEQGHVSPHFLEHRDRNGRSRLDTWKAAGLADQTEQGTWLLHPQTLEEAPAVRKRAATQTRTAAEIVDRMLNGRHG